MRGAVAQREKKNGALTILTMFNYIYNYCQLYSDVQEAPLQLTKSISFFHNIY